MRTYIILKRSQPLLLNLLVKVVGSDRRGVYTKSKNTATKGNAVKIRPFSSLAASCPIFRIIYSSILPFSNAFIIRPISGYS